jgi:hypothetical protein
MDERDLTLCPGLIAYRLMKVQMQLRRHGVSTIGGLSGRITRILVESAALYSFNHLLYAILYEAKNQVESTPSFLVSFARNLVGSHHDKCKTGSNFGEHHLQLNNSSH